ncbi:MAG: VOC family protein [Phycisphaerales bacterium]
MANDLVHFAVHADDCERAMRFYEGVFGWRFEAWGPPGFWLIRTSPGGAVGGALQERREPVSGRGMIGFECTIGVEDVAAIASAIRSAGGTVTMEPYLIEGVGTLIQFEDTEGNRVCAMQYVGGAKPCD